MNYSLNYFIVNIITIIIASILLGLLIGCSGKETPNGTEGDSASMHSVATTRSRGSRQSSMSSAFTARIKEAK